MKIKGRYVAQVVIDLETADVNTETTEGNFYVETIKKRWYNMNSNLQKHLDITLFPFETSKVTQQYFDMYEVKN